MSPLKTLFYQICFWHRRWKLVASKIERWHSERGYNLDLTTGELTNIEWDRNLVLENCELTGLERAYYQDNEKFEKVKVTYAKNRLGLSTK